MYPADTDDPEYPVVDLVVCHGDFLNADRMYVHKNTNVRGFGSYGDIIIRDRKMYVAPTPFALTDGTTGQVTLIVPAEHVNDDRLDVVGELVRVESEQMVVGYTADLTTNELKSDLVLNPSAGVEHHFMACRRKGMGSGTVVMKRREDVQQALPLGDDG